MYDLSRLYGVGAWQIAQANGLQGEDLLLTGQILLIPNLTGSQVLESQAEATAKAVVPTNTSTATSIPTPAPTAVVEAEWPQALRLGESDSVRVSLIQGSKYTNPTIEANGHTIAVLTAGPVADAASERMLSQAFGAQYVGYAVARLGATNFEMIALDDEKQRLDHSRIEWEWSITPHEKAIGAQAIIVTIDGLWESHGGDASIARPIWRGRLSVLVDGPVPLGQFGSTASGVLFFLGVTLNVPNLYRMVTRKGRKRRLQSHSVSGRELPGNLFDELSEALIGACPTPQALRQMVRVQLDLNLWAVTAERNLEEMVFDLICWAESKGRVDELIKGARAANPENPMLEACEEEIRRWRQ